MEIRSEEEGPGEERHMSSNQSSSPPPPDGPDLDYGQAAASPADERPRERANEDAASAGRSPGHRRGAHPSPAPTAYDARDVSQGERIVNETPRHERIVLGPQPGAEAPPTHPIQDPYGVEPEAESPEAGYADDVQAVDYDLQDETAVPDVPAAPRSEPPRTRATLHEHPAARTSVPRRPPGPVDGRGDPQGRRPARSDAEDDGGRRNDARPTREVYGSAKNIAELGSPIDRAQDERIRYYFFPTWRSQLLNLLGFFVLCVICIWASHTIPYLVVPGPLFSIFGTTVYLYLPVLVLLPGWMLGKILINIYDAKFIIDETGVEAQIGLVSFSLRQPRLRWEDIRGSEPQQTIWERILGIGSVLVGSAMTQDVEIVMSGVANPKAIQLLIQGERDRRLRELRGAGNRASEYKIHAVLSD